MQTDYARCNTRQRSECCRGYFFNLAAGFGAVTVEGETLAAGIYNYTLVIDGNKMDTKERWFLRK